MKHLKCFKQVKPTSCIEQTPQSNVTITLKLAERRIQDGLIQKKYMCWQAERNIIRVIQ